MVKTISSFFDCVERENVGNYLDRIPKQYHQDLLEDNLYMVYESLEDGDIALRSYVSYKFDWMEREDFEKRLEACEISVNEENQRKKKASRDVDFHHLIGLIDDSSPQMMEIKENLMLHERIETVHRDSWGSFLTIRAWAENRLDEKADDFELYLRIRDGKWFLVRIADEMIVESNSDEFENDDFWDEDFVPVKFEMKIFVFDEN